MIHWIFELSTKQDDWGGKDVVNELFSDNVQELY